MVQLHRRNLSLKRLLSATFGRRSRRSRQEEQTTGTALYTEDNASPAHKSTPAAAEVSSTVKSTWRCFSYGEIHKATNGFHKDNLVGRGGHADVYRGVTADGGTIAVKRMKATATAEQLEKDFLMELGAVSHVRHPNVSTLLGCCLDGGGLHLIFEFSSRGSVSANLYAENSPPMAWKLRYNIAVGTARGLDYLHRRCRRRIIHRDIKASNILLTETFEPLISDFDLARWLPPEWTHLTVSPIEGTLGCLAPEYVMHGIVDEKTDVFAFGVFLLEVVSGRKPVGGSHWSLLSWARSHLDDGSIQNLVDPRLGEDYDAGQLKRLAFSASLCIRRTAALRPSMTEVVELLESAEIAQSQWKLPCAEEEEEEELFWEFDDLNNDMDDHDTPLMSSSRSSSYILCQPDQHIS